MNTLTKNIIRRSIALGAVGVLGLTACGSDDSTASEAAATATDQAAEAGVTISVPLPDSEAIALARKDVVGFALTSTSELLSELRQLNDNTSNILLLLEKRSLRDSDIRGIDAEEVDGEVEDPREVFAGKRK